MVKNPWQPEETSTVEETIAEAALKYYESQEEYLEEEGKEAFASYYVHTIDTVNNYYAVGVYGNQVAAASGPVFGATMLETLTQQVAGKPNLSIAFNNKMLPSNNPQIPMWKPAIAEGFGLSLLTATVIVMTFQVKDFGEPVNKGFLTAFMVSGGHR